MVTYEVVRLFVITCIFSFSRKGHQKSISIRYGGAQKFRTGATAILPLQLLTALILCSFHVSWSRTSEFVLSLHTLNLVVISSRNA